MDSYNESDVVTCPPYLPYVGEYLTELSATYIVLFSIAGAATLITCCLFIETNVFFWKHLKNWKPRDKAKWLVAVYPIVCVTAMVALLVPRAATLNDLVASSYLSVCIYLFVTMLIGHYGGASKMMKRLEGAQITLNLPPLACCCPCLPHPKLTSRRIRLLETSVLQYALVRPITAYIAAVLMANDDFGLKPNASVWRSGALWLQIVNTISVLTAMYGFQVIYDISQVPLSRTAVRPKFRCLQSVLFINGIQESIIKLFVVFRIIPCDPPLNPSGGADRFHHLLVIAEIFVINLVARKYYRRHVGTIPPEDAVQVETRDMGAETTNSLLRDCPGAYLPSRSSSATRGSRGSAASIFALPDFSRIIRRFSRTNSVPADRSNLTPSTIDATKLYFERQGSSKVAVDAGDDPMPDDSVLRSKSQQTSSTSTARETFHPSSRHTLPVLTKSSSTSPSPPLLAQAQNMEDLQDVPCRDDTLDPSKIKLEIRGSYPA